MCSKIVSLLLSIALTLCIFSPGSLQDRSSSDRVARSRGRNVHTVDAGEVLPGSESSSDSLEGSGQSLDRTFWSGIIIPQGPQPNLSKHCGSVTTLIQTVFVCWNSKLGDPSYIADISNNNLSRYSCETFPHLQL